MPIPSMAARAARVPCAPWFGIHAVSRPSSPQAAAAARVSIGAGATRWFSIVRLTTTSQSPNRPGSNCAVSPKDAATFVPASGNSSAGAPAASAISTTAGRTS